MLASLKGSVLFKFCHPPWGQVLDDRHVPCLSPRDVTKHAHAETIACLPRWVPVFSLHYPAFLAFGLATLTTRRWVRQPIYPSILAFRCPGRFDCPLVSSLIPGASFSCPMVSPPASHQADIPNYSAIGPITYHPCICIIPLHSPPALHITR